MGQSRVAIALVVSLAFLVLAAAPSVIAEEHRETFFIEDVYTAEQMTTRRDVKLRGDSILEAWFNFTVFEDKINSQPDSFQFTVTNMDDALLTQSLPGMTDTEGRLTVTLPFTLEGSPRWRVSVFCTEAGDTVVGPLVIDEDGGNPWDLQVEYVYFTDDGGNGNGGSGGDGSAGLPSNGGGCDGGRCGDLGAGGLANLNKAVGVCSHQEHCPVGSSPSSGVLAASVAR